MKAGDRAENPATGERGVVRVGSEDTNGERLVVDLFVPAGGRVPLPHRHPALTESLEVLDGQLDVAVDGDHKLAVAGQKITIPPDVVHDWWNGGGGEAHVVVEISGPTTRRFELMIEAFWGLARDGKTDDKGVPSLLQLAVIAREFADVVQVTKPPRIVQKLVFGMLAPIGRARGYRAFDRLSDATTQP